MKLDKLILERLLVGSSFLGTGGGGRIDIAKKLLKKINRPVELIDIETVKNNDLIITTFGIGGLKKTGNFTSINTFNMRILKDTLKREVEYLIPVEIGPVSVFNLLLTASLLSIPVIDGDLVGFRSSPEIYLEGITINKSNRLPLVASNSDGDSLILLKSKSVERIETILRNFSAASQTKVYVAGYPLTKKNIIKNFGNKSIDYSIKIGKIIIDSEDNDKLISSLEFEQIKYIDRGMIIKQDEFKIKGFTAGKLTVLAKKNKYEIIYKNEFLVLLKNNKTLLTCPDSILLLDINNKIGINNGDQNIGKSIIIFTKKAQNYWRSKDGLKLFSPKNLGLNYEQKLL